MNRVFLPGKKSRIIRQRLQAWARPATGLVAVVAVAGLVVLLASQREQAAWVAPASATSPPARTVVLASLGLPTTESSLAQLPDRSLILGSLGLPTLEAPVTAAAAPRPPARRKMPSGHLSPYDDLIRTESERLGLDWRLIAAIMYEESQFDPRAMNRSGARGLMQVMPASAGVPADSLFDPLTNIQAGLRIFHRSFQGFADLDSLDRLQFAVAAYNAGMGRINDARRIAMEIGLDPDRWQGSVADAFLHLSDPRWHDQVKHGAYPGRGTVVFVDETLERYERYAERVERAGPPAASEDDLASVTPIP
jgi:soluble lytic murein transglycosylase-like protein